MLINLSLCYIITKLNLCQLFFQLGLIELKAKYLTISVKKKAYNTHIVCLCTWTCVYCVRRHLRLHCIHTCTCQRPLSLQVYMYSSAYVNINMMNMLLNTIDVSPIFDFPHFPSIFDQFKLRSMRPTM